MTLTRYCATSLIFVKVSRLNNFSANSQMTALDAFTSSLFLSRSLSHFTGSLTSYEYVGKTFFEK